MNIIAKQFKFVSALARQNFLSFGHQLPAIYLEVVEGMRARSSWEQTYEKYMDEVLSEYVQLTFPWQPGIRQTLPASARSTYLDKLSESFGSQSASLDPNFNALMAADHVWVSALAKCRQAKELEIRNWATSSGQVMFGASLLDSLINIAAGEGLSPASKVSGRPTAITFAGERLTVVLQDLFAIQKRGHTIVQYFFEIIPNKPFGINNFVPGGELYCEWNKTPEAVLFSFATQCRFAKIVAERLALN